ncbi:MAG: metallophosphoesterase family protein [Candidatus Dormibacteraceae bacterium]
MRIGVVADTHCPEYAEHLPARLAGALAGVELILHAGDINGEATLAELGLIAPVEAVRGDHDAELVNLPPTREFIVEGKKIVVTHGDRSRWLEEPQTLLWTVTLGYFHPHAGLPRALRRRFPDADVIVYGHTHRARVDMLDGVLVFNPGGVHQWNPTTARRRLAAGRTQGTSQKAPGWFEWCWLQVARHLRSFPRPSIGILDFGTGGVVPRVIAL